MLSHVEKLYKCLICTKTFKDRHHFEGHVNKHKDIKPLSFQRCKLKFSHKVSKGAKIRNRYNQVPHLTFHTQLLLIGIRVFAKVRART